MPRALFSVTRKRVSAIGPQHGVRVAELVVERSGRGDRRPEPAQHLRQQVLGRRLARRAGDADDGDLRAAGAAPRGPGRRARRSASATSMLGPSTGRVHDRRRPRRPRSRRAAKSWPSCALARHGQEQPARSDPARVELDAAGDDGGRIGAAGQPAADDRRRPRPGVSSIIAAGPGCGLLDRAPELDPVVERVHDPGDLLAGLVALAGDQHGVARPGGGRPRPRSRRARPATSWTSARSPPATVARAREHRRPGSRPDPPSAGCRR